MSPEGKAFLDKGTLRMFFKHSSKKTTEAKDSTKSVRNSSAPASRSRSGKSVLEEDPIEVFDDNDEDWEARIADSDNEQEAESTVPETSTSRARSSSNAQQTSQEKLYEDCLAELKASRIKVNIFAIPQLVSLNWGQYDSTLSSTILCRTRYCMSSA